MALARDLGLRVSVHIHGGRAVAEMHDRGLLDERTTLVHGNRVSDDQLAMLADAGCSVSISPDVELKMGIGAPATGRMLAAGIRPSLSIDDCPSVGGDMFAALRTAFAVQRGLDGGLTAHDVVEFATDLPALRGRLLESRDRIAAAAGVPLDGSWVPEVQDGV
nr:hypothetical protein GCM10020063_034940 [Dactylosporangium thailandense]